VSGRDHRGGVGDREEALPDFLDGQRSEQVWDDRGENGPGLEKRTPAGYPSQPSWELEWNVEKRGKEGTALW